MNKRVTICDIAEAAGVSACCVSWVLRNHPRSQDMNADTRQRILDTAAKLGYVQNQLAAATRTGQVNTIAVILSFKRFRNMSTLNHVINGILMESSARQHGIKIFTEEDIDSTFRLILENSIAKVISLSIDPGIREKTAAHAKERGLDLVFCYEHGHAGYFAVNVDNAEITAMAVHYLAERGHSRIGLLCVPHTHHYTKDRHAGYLQGLKECGLKADPRWISCSDDIEQAVENMIALPVRQRPTALVTLADSVAARAQRVILKHGLRVPEDFSMTGIGDMECAAFTATPITTLDESLTESGKLLVQLVLGDQPDFGHDEFNVYHTHAKIIERESVYNRKNRR